MKIFVKKFGGVNMFSYIYIKLLHYCLTLIHYDYESENLQ